MPRLFGFEFDFSRARQQSTSSNANVPGIEGGHLDILDRVEPAKRENFPSFSLSASDQPVLRTDDRFALARARLKDAFTPSHPVSRAALFAGRRSLLETIIQGIEDQKMHTVLYGERGIGKTSTVQAITRIASDARYFVVYVSCNAETTFDHVVRRACNEIPLRFHKDFGGSSQLGDQAPSFATLLPAHSVSVNDAAELFGNVVGTRVLIVLDEFDRAEQAEFRRRMAEFLKSLSDQSARVQLLIAGVAQNLIELLSNVPSSQRNISAVEIPKMTDAEIDQLIQNGCNFAGVKFTPEAVSMVAVVANGFPYLASNVSLQSAIAAIGQESLIITADHVRYGLSYILDNSHGHVSSEALDAIDSLESSGKLDFLGVLAGRAQTRTTEFGMEDVRSIGNSAESISSISTLLEQEARAGVLIQRAGEDGEPRYNFANSNIRHFLWLRTVAGRLRALQLQGSSRIHTP